MKMRGVIGVATLYLTEQRSYVRKDGDTLVIQIPENKEKNTEKHKVRVPLVKVDQVVVMGDSTISTPALLALLEQNSDVCLCSYHGNFRGRLAPGFSKNSLLRIEQHRAHDDPERSFWLAKAFVQGKLANQRTLLLRSNRRRKEPAVTRAASSLKSVLAKVEELQADGGPTNPLVPQANSAIGALLGLEGAGSSFYFSAFEKLLNQDLSFRRRTKRPPTDPVNALLSYGYVLLMNKVASATQLVGMDPFVGYLHSSQYGKPALALDLMEELRPIIVDSVVLTVINNRILKEEDFEEQLGACRLSESGRRSFLTKFEERLNTELRHPTFGYKATYKKCLELQVRLLAKTLTGEIPSYPPILVR
jgi:CRISPR-associated protein Cas1